jgi:CheY-like chemotaxis protein
MDDATRLRIFEPFFTTKPVGQGTGLGLAMVFGTVQGHDGAIDVESAPGRGAVFRIYLPLAAAPSVPRAVGAGSGRTPRRGIALVVDDEALVRKTTARLLEVLGFRVVTAEHGAAAIDVFERRASEIGLVVLDMSMPVMSGPECFRRLRERSRVPILLVSGYAADRHARATLESAGTGFLDKPFTAQQLGEQVERLLGAAPGAPVARERRASAAS